MLAVQGPTGCRYLDNPERQQQYVKNGWNLPGDAYMMDEDGYFWYQARADDMIVSAGYNIAGPEVEAVLLDHPAVAECGVVGLPDPQRGQVVSAFVVLRESYTGDERMTKELQDFVKAEIAPYKYPRRIEFLNALPRTQTGEAAALPAEGGGENEECRMKRCPVHAKRAAPCRKTAKLLSHAGAATAAIPLSSFHILNSTFL